MRLFGYSTDKVCWWKLLWFSWSMAMMTGLYDTILGVTDAFVPFQPCHHHHHHRSTTPHRRDHWIITTVPSSSSSSSSSLLLRRMTSSSSSSENVKATWETVDHHHNNHHNQHPTMLIETTNDGKHQDRTLSILSDPSSSMEEDNERKLLGPIASSLVRLGLCMYVASVCVSLTCALIPQALMFRWGLINRRRKEVWAWKTGQFCCFWMLRLFPFCQLQSVSAYTSNNNNDIGSTPDRDDTFTSTTKQQTSSPCIWVCNHTSLLDVFMLLAADASARGTRSKRRRGQQQQEQSSSSSSQQQFPLRGGLGRLAGLWHNQKDMISSSSRSPSLHRPIKIIYWKQLEDNFVTKLLFQQAGFLSVDMAANGHGIANEYDKRTFKTLLRESKQALLDDHFDLGILPEGQLNPKTEEGVLPIFSGAYTLSKLCGGIPIGMMALHGCHDLWHPLHGMICRRRQVRVRCYPQIRTYATAEDFVETFTHVVGHFGKTGQDVDDWSTWMDGSYRQENEEQDHAVKAS